MENVVLFLAYERPGENPIGVARLNDRDLIVQVASRAIAAAQAAAKRVGHNDPVMDRISREQVAALRSSLFGLIPELDQPLTVN